MTAPALDPLTMSPIELYRHEKAKRAGVVNPVIAEARAELQAAVAARQPVVGPKKKDRKPAGEFNPRAPKTLQVCLHCGSAKYQWLTRKRCSTCAHYLKKHGVDRPLPGHTKTEATR